MEKGLLCSVYRPGNMGDCTNGGVSSRYHALILVGKDVPGVFETEGRESVVRLIYREKWGDFIAAPLDYGKGRHYMFGGNFLYTSDSRFPVSHPIKIHDRLE